MTGKQLFTRYEFHFTNDGLKWNEITQANRDKWIMVAKELEMDISRTASIILSKILVRRNADKLLYSRLNKLNSFEMRLITMAIEDVLREITNGQ